MNIGDHGEDFVEAVCQTPLGRDFLFRGQKYQSGQGEIELCDLFTLFGDTAVLIEVKTADRIKRPNRTEDEWVKYANARLEDAMIQLERGANALRSGSVKTVENARQGRVVIDPTKLKHIFGIAVIDHPTLEKWGGRVTIDAAGLPVSVLTTTHAELIELFTELSTVGDLIDYLEAREVFYSKHQLLGNTELDLLAFYKADPERFQTVSQDCDTVIIEEGVWDAFAAQECRQDRQRLDHPSLIVDRILDFLHEDRGAELPHIQELRRRQGKGDDAENRYIKVATEIARMRRIDRRVVGEGLIKRSEDCLSSGRERWLATSPISDDGCVCVFMVSTESRSDRLGHLHLVVLGAMLKSKSRLGVGVVTEPIGSKGGFSIDATMISGDPEKLVSQMSPDLQEELSRKFGAPYKPDVTEFGGHGSRTSEEAEPRE